MLLFPITIHERQIPFSDDAPSVPVGAQRPSAARRMSSLMRSLTPGALITRRCRMRQIRDGTNLPKDSIVNNRSWKTKCVAFRRSQRTEAILQACSPISTPPIEVDHSKLLADSIAQITLRRHTSSSTTAPESPQLAHVREVKARHTFVRMDTDDSLDEQ